MAEIITDRELRHSIESTISHSQFFLFVVSPYIDLDEDLKKAFSHLKPDVVKTIVYRKSDNSNINSGISKESRLFFKSLPNIELVAVKNLHAKFFMNEEYTVISTMNLTSSSNHNYEIGIEIDNEKEYGMFQECLDYLIYDILDSEDSDISEERLKNIIPKQLFILDYNSSEVKINGAPLDLKKFESFHKSCNTKHGYCIRCESTKIDFYPNRPLCPKCFSEWNKYKNSNYEEKHCHRCGMEANTSINLPLCEPCSDIYEFEIKREWEKMSKKESIN